MTGESKLLGLLAILLGQAIGVFLLLTVLLTVAIVRLVEWKP